MENLALGAQVALAIVFATAAVGKLLDPAGSRDALTAFRVPSSLVRRGAMLLPALELAIAGAVLAPPTARTAAVAAVALLLVFAVAIGAALRRGEEPDCHCFGQLHSAPAGLGTAVRNLGLAAVALFVALQGPALATGASTSAETVAATGTVTTLLLLAAAMSLHRGSRRLQRELETVKAASDLFPPGLPLGVAAPGFSLRGVRGEQLTLESLIARRNPVVLIFADPSCGPCARLLPDIGRWQGSLADRLTLVVVSTGSIHDNMPFAQEHGLTDIVLQERNEVMDSYRVQGTPSAIVISADRTIASGVAAGEFEVEELVRLALRRETEAGRGSERLA